MVGSRIDACRERNYFLYRIDLPLNIRRSPSFSESLKTSFEGIVRNSHAVLIEIHSQFQRGLPVGQAQVEGLLKFRTL